ncbi:hypothetical protein, partial [Microcoleus sp. B7-D4]|uniref:hypothetical protein n=1 Tax=Microcoleus sp. B7-D4 TaxID=2818696 RepID=UPI002FD2B037
SNHHKGLALNRSPCSYRHNYLKTRAGVSRGLILPDLQLCLPINTTDAMLAKCLKRLGFTRSPTVPIAHTIVAAFALTTKFTGLPS